LKTLERLRSNQNLVIQSHVQDDFSGYIFLRSGNSRVFNFYAHPSAQYNGTLWEHVGVTNIMDIDAPPTWEEMREVKDTFWYPDEEVHIILPSAKELSPLKTPYKNHRFYLHLWRPLKGWLYS